MFFFVLCRITFLFLTAFCILCLGSKATPVVVWHGMGDSGFNSFSIGSFKQFIEHNIKGIHVVPLTIGSNRFQDTLSGFWSSVNEQVEDVCRQLRNDVQLREGYNAIGFSQGGQFLRAVAQRCPVPRMRNLITIGSQHQGVYGVPHCPAFMSAVCGFLAQMLSLGAYFRQVQAQYWHDPFHEDVYRQHNAFLADINQEQYLNPDYKTNLMKLENLVMIKFLNDTMVKPIETQWFGFFKPGQAEEVMTMRESELYLKDKLGLQEMDKRGRVHFYAVEGNHLQFSDRWFLRHILNKYLR